MSQAENNDKMGTQNNNNKNNEKSKNEKTSSCCVLLFLFGLVVLFIVVSVHAICTVETEKDSILYKVTLTMPNDAEGQSSALVIEHRFSAKRADSLFLPLPHTVTNQESSFYQLGEVTVRRSRQLLWEHMVILLLITSILSIFVWGFVRVAEEA